ncbi:MAG: chorismate synthase [Alphaproteobacteria bacterium]|nr:chorismate synthase [Alphaproteobacteria bacterium]
MTGNRFGTLFQYQTFGESHGPAIGAIVDGVPPGIALVEDDIQHYLNRRKPGQSRFTTQRREPDAVRILSGVFEGVTTGTPIGLLIENTDQKSKDYADIKDKFRPGHADFTYMEKYGLRDYRGGGRSSARETAMRVAAGAVARKVLEAQIGSHVLIRAVVVQIGPHRIDRARWDWAQVDNSPFFTPDAAAAETFSAFLDETRKRGSSAGAIVEVHADGIPPGLGAPVYDKLDADLAKALMSINAVKGVEIGAGFESAALSGEENADEMRIDPEAGTPAFLSNKAGGILGGISSGQTIIARLAFKPTSSILKSGRTIDVQGNETEIATKGRHDPCVGIRGVPVAEAMVACVLADHWLRHKAQCL